MKAFTYRFVAITGLWTALVAFVGCSFTGQRHPQKPAPHPIKIIAGDEGFFVTESGRKILFYQCRTKCLDGKHCRANYVHPLYDLNGEILTEDFPPDHPHHRGIFWAWHQIYVGKKRIGDGWSLQNISWDVHDVKLLDVDSNCRGLEVNAHWKSPLWTDAAGKQKPFIRETTTVRVHRTEDDFRKIDFTISLLALEDDVRLGGAKNAKEYGGFSTRIRLPEGIVFSGPAGPVEPKGTPVTAAPWMDFSGPFGDGGSLSGLSVLCHKSNPLYPHRWILRRKGSMQNPVWPGQLPVLIPRQQPVVLRYRLIIHSGDANHIDLNKLHAEYNAE
ncbi:MAG: DUF6807 family protein [Planctomycetota bacterium]|jgi:hypothetical protein